MVASRFLDKNIKKQFLHITWHNNFLLTPLEPKLNLVT